MIAILARAQNQQKIKLMLVEMLSYCKQSIFRGDPLKLASWGDYLVIK